MGHFRRGGKHKINEALWHISEKTTSIYLGSISNPVLAEANRRITDLTHQKPKKK